MNNVKINLNDIKILTPDGYKNFSGMQKLHKECLNIKLSDRNIRCSTNHRVLTLSGFKIASELEVDEYVVTKTGHDKIFSIENIGEHEVYDLLNVENNQYYTNGIVSHNCEFDNVGDAEIDMDTFDELQRECMVPLYELEDGCYKIWENPDPTKLYVAGVDVAEGAGRDYTVIQILDITDVRQIKQVAVYANNRITPIEFTPKLREILQNWGDPLALIEANNCGALPVQNLKKDFNYENIVSWGITKVGSAYDRQRLGIVSHTNTKFNGVKNMKYFVNTARRVKIFDTTTVNELKDFVRHKNGSFGAKHGSNDDRVMALVWALMILHSDLVGRYFDVQEYDENQQALHIKPIDFGINYFMNPKSIYNPAENGAGGDALPSFISQMREPANMELDDLYSEGWTRL